MEEQRQTLVKGLILGCLATLAFLGIAGLIVVYTGAYNVAATEGHTSVVRWAFDTTFRTSVRQRAADVPTASVTPALLASGAEAYRSMCQHCHGGPGVEREKWADGMRPRPPHLVDAAPEWNANEVFWIAKHGIRMTGMPAFGPTHDDSTLAGVAAFVKALPGMTPERYQKLGGGPMAGSGEPATHRPAPDTAAAGASRSGPTDR